jgi:hypothetical protein
METTKPNRRWFQFSLRTFLIVITLIGGWLGWNLYEVRQRESYRTALAGNAYPFSGNQFPWRQRKMPWMWSLLGAVPVESIRLDSAEGYGMTDALEMAKWFPEANVILWDSNRKAHWITN